MNDSLTSGDGGRQVAGIGQARNARVAYDGCPICGSADIRHHREDDCTAHPLYRPALPATICWKLCGTCGHSFTGGVWSDWALELIFAQANPNQWPGAYAERERMTWAPVVEKVARLRPSGRWLDVGIGNGSLLFTAAEWGFDTLGLDLRPAVADAMSKLGVATRCAHFTDLPRAERFDVISMFDVLEHMPYPVPALRHANQLLNAEGLLLLSLPNRDCAVWRMLDEERLNPYWGEIEHYHNFGRKQLCGLLEDAGLQPLSYGVSPRYRVCMELIARKPGGSPAAGAAM
jgi:SAM-dependent methyltransferase